MAKLVWDISNITYETGVSNGVLYPMGENGYTTGVAWNGLTAVNEAPSGADITAVYADNSKALSLQAAEEYGGTIEALMYPDEWEECDGSRAVAQGVNIGQQTRKAFGLCYKTLIGNDAKGTDLGYKLHIVYNCKAQPSSRDHATVNESPEAATMSWEFTSTPVSNNIGKPSATVTIDSTKVSSANLAKLEAKLYGGESESATLPTIDEIAALLD